MNTNIDLPTSHKIIKISGFIAAYFLFTTVLYFILLLSDRLSKKNGYLLIMFFVALINLLGWGLKKFLK